MKKSWLLVGALALRAFCGCGAAPAVTTMTGSFEVCAKADLGLVITTAGDTLLKYVTQLIDANPTNLVADLEQVAAQVGKDAVVCAIEAYASVKQPASPGTPATMEAPPGLLTARMWAVSK